MTTTDERLAALDKACLDAVAAINGGVFLLDDAEKLRVCEALVFAKSMNVNLRLENVRLRAALRFCAASAQLAAEREGP